MTEIHRIKCGNGNCYILSDNNSSVLIDTSKKEYADKVVSECKRRNVKLLILTHAHFDHAENAAYISETLGIPIAMSEKDCGLIKDNSSQSLSAVTLLGKIILGASLKNLNSPIPAFKPDILLKDGDILSDKYGINARIIALPGHTDGSIGIDADEKFLIVGDALMNMVYPAVSPLYHNRDEMLASAEKISSLGDRLIFFGHGKPLKNRKWVK